MDDKIVDEEINKCLLTISDELYNFHSEIVRMLGCIEYIEYLLALRDRNLSNHLQ